MTSKGVNSSLKLGGQVVMSLVIPMKSFYVIYERSLLIDPGDILSHWDPKFDLEDSIEEYNLAEAAHAHGKNCCCSFIFLQLEAYCSLIPNV